jgi:hypothetical protein
MTTIIQWLKLISIAFKLITTKHAEWLLFSKIYQEIDLYLQKLKDLIT